MIKSVKQDLLIRWIVRVIPRIVIRSFPVQYRSRVKLLLSNTSDRKIKERDTGPTFHQAQLENIDFPAHWRSKVWDWSKRKSSARVCIIFHVYYLNLIPEFLEYFNRITFEFDLIITNSSGEKLDENFFKSSLGNNQLRDLLLLDCPNRGRDILPLIYCVNSGILDSYSFFFKFHTKKSEWANGRVDMQGTGANWRLSFLDDLIGNGSNSTRILNCLSTLPNLGIVTSTGSLKDDSYWSVNLERTQELASRLEMDFEPENLLFPAGSMYACKALIIQGLRALCLTTQDFELESGQIDGTTAHAVERLIGLLIREGAYSQTDLIGLQENNDKVEISKNLKVIAFYLPQFHKAPINDINWGTGFTEWNNVTRATPQFNGHFQPILPTDFGFYDLSIDSQVVQQEKFALEIGVSAFMYYYYDFGDQQVLTTPIRNRIKRSGGMPFCLMWANENWSRNWDGLEKEIIAAQKYDVGWEVNFVQRLREVLTHPDYLKDELNRPIISIYRSGSIPKLEIAISNLRHHAREVGIGEICILFADTDSSFDQAETQNSAQLSDGLHGFPPHGASWNLLQMKSNKMLRNFQGSIYKYDHQNYFKKIKNMPSTYFPGVLTRFDNTPRRGPNAHIIFGSNPFSFRKALVNALSIKAESNSAKILFLNAWNEWAEGAILEPNNRFGRTYGFALREVTHFIYNT